MIRVWIQSVLLMGSRRGRSYPQITQIFEEGIGFSGIVRLVPHKDSCVRIAVS
jgi:hypothetical protein